MMCRKSFFYLAGIIFLSFSLSGCFADKTNEFQSNSAGSAPTAKTDDIQTLTPSKALPPPLPVKYQSASYVVANNLPDNDSLGGIDEEYQVKVGAKITSKSSMPLWDILKRIAGMKNMSISWAKDVDQNAKVDVNIQPRDSLDDAVNNLLGQLGYFAEIEGTTIFVHNKITKSYQIAMPFLSQSYTTNTGGDIIGASESGNSLSAKIGLSAKGSPIGTQAFSEGDSKAQKVEFDTWANIETNLKVLLDILETSEVETNAYEQQYGAQRNSSASYNNYSGDGSVSGSNSNALIGGGASGSGSGSRSVSGDTTAQSSTDANRTRQKVKTARQVSRDGSYFIIDKPVGIVTITTTRELHKKVGQYLKNLSSSIYQQISIEAKIIEVRLADSSSIGINWSSVLKNFNLNGIVEFGSGGQIYPFIYNNDKVNGENTYVGDDNGSYFKTINPGQFVSKVSLNPANFSVFLNALNEQGDTKILSNPKISVLNGQPAFITVGENITYIDNIESNLDSDSGVITSTVNTERILSGIGMALTATILDGKEIIMNLVPITSELQEPIEYKDVGTLGGTVGLPRVNIREMNTIVKVKDGEMLVIGGLISEVEQKQGEFAPGLGSIPFVKYLFGYEEKTKTKREMIILLRPRII